MIKTLVFIDDNYPLTVGEFFVDDEMKIIAPSFHQVLVLTAAQPSTNTMNRYMPENMKVISYNGHTLFANKLKSIPIIISGIFDKEWCFVMRKLSPRYWWQAFKIMYMDMHRAYRLKQYILSVISQQNINIADAVFYSYWHDYKALALAMLKQEYSMTTCIARAHGWDVFADRSTPAYLPFKSYIVQHLNATYSISQAGKAYMESYIGVACDNKIKVSHLGKFNHRTPLYNKPDSSIHICSCSNIVPLKRIDKIIEVLSVMHVANITWTHFGNGPMMDAMQLYATQLLPHVQCEFKGIVPNSEILDYYAHNYVDVFINMSDSEGIPVSIMEALSAGIPVLATRVGGTAEAVNNDNGFIVEPHTDVTEIAAILDEYLSSNSNNQMQKRQQAYRYWQENYEAGKNYKQLLQEIFNM